MPLTSFNFDASVQAAIQTPVVGFNPRTDTVNLAFGAETSLPASNPVGIWNQANAQFLALNPNGSATIDCYTFTNLTGGSVTATSALGIAVFPTGGDVTITPSAVNPLNWFFVNGNSTTGLVAFNNACFFNSRAGSDTGTTAVSAGARGLLFTNGNGSASIGVTICVIEAGTATA